MKMGMGRLCIVQTTLLYDFNRAPPASKTALDITSPTICCFPRRCYGKSGVCGWPHRRPDVELAFCSCSLPLP